MRYSGTVACSVATLAVFLACPAYGQETKRFDIQLNLVTVYDDNVARSGAAVAAARGLEQEDVIVSPTVTLDILQPVGRQALFLQGLAGYNFYNENDQLNRERVSLQGGASVALGPCVGALTGGFTRQQSELDDLSLIATKNVETLTTVGANAACGRPTGFAPTFSVEQQWLENEGALTGASDYQETTGEVGIAYRRPSFGELTLFGSVGRTEYEDRLANPGQSLEKDGYDVYSGGLRFNRRLGARLEGTLNAGYASIRPFSDATEDFEGFTYGADLTFRPSGRIDGTLSFSRSVSPSMRLQATYAVEEIYRLQANYRIGSRLALTIGGSYAESEYEGAGAGPTSGVGDEQIKSAFASLRFDLGRRLAVALGVNQQDRDADVPGFDYTANRVEFSLIAKY